MRGWSHPVCAFQRTESMWSEKFWPKTRLLEGGMALEEEARSTCSAEASMFARPVASPVIGSMRMAGAEPTAGFTWWPAGLLRHGAVEERCLRAGAAAARAMLGEEEEAEQEAPLTAAETAEACRWSVRGSPDERSMLKVS